MIRFDLVFFSETGIPGERQIPSVNGGFRLAVDIKPIQKFSSFQLLDITFKSSSSAGRTILSITTSTDTAISRTAKANKKNFFDLKFRIREIGEHVVIFAIRLSRKIFTAVLKFE
jgi:hypothetical protein